VFTAVGVLVFLASGCTGPDFVDQVTIVNDTAYSAKVDVTDRTRDGWLGLTAVEPHSTLTVEEVIDQGQVWIFRFDYVGQHHEEVEVSRAELERNDWTTEVPQSFEQRLREQGLPPPP
jgi:hypothetical protein